MIELNPCPFCGRKPPEDLIDWLYPTGQEWVDRGNGFRSYHRIGQGRKEAQPNGLKWGTVYKMCCNSTEGGCGAEIHRDTREEVIAAWNRRPTLQATISDQTVLESAFDHNVVKTIDPNSVEGHRTVQWARQMMAQTHIRKVHASEIKALATDLSTEYQYSVREPDPGAQWTFNEACLLEFSFALLKAATTADPTPAPCPNCNGTGILTTADGGRQGCSRCWGSGRLDAPAPEATR